MEEFWFVLFAVAVDGVIGDPRAIPHPVIGIGKLIHFSEKYLMKFGAGRRWERGLGIILVLLVLFVVYLAVTILLKAAELIHPIFYAMSSIWLISTTIAAKGLKDAANQVLLPLAKGDLEEARKYVGYIVGRDTDKLSEGEVVRATVETVAENIVDAVAAPIFYALIGGAPLAMIYRAVNTLDSMVGYKNDKYRYFGWASARLDDVLNYIPARITGMLLLVVAWGSRGLSAKQAWTAWRRDAAKHPSPNSGIPEALVAGALGVELGGLNSYGGIVSERARMGTALRDLQVADIQQMNSILDRTVALMMICLVVAIGIGVIIR